MIEQIIVPFSRLRLHPKSPCILHKKVQNVPLNSIPVILELHKYRPMNPNFGRAVVTAPHGGSVFFLVLNLPTTEYQPRQRQVCLKCPWRPCTRLKCFVFLLHLVRHDVWSPKLSGNNQHSTSWLLEEKLYQEKHTKKEFKTKQDVQKLSVYCTGVLGQCLNVTYGLSD